MSNQDNINRPQKVATPAFLPKRLLAFRIGRGDKQSYVLRDNVKGQSYDFEPWQFFVLEVLPGCGDEEKLSSVFEDRFGHPLDAQMRDLFFASLADAGLFNEAAASHPLLARFKRTTYVVEGEHAAARSHQDLVAEQWQMPAATVPPADRTVVAPAPTADAPMAARAGASVRGTTLVPNRVPLPGQESSSGADGQVPVQTGETVVPGTVQTPFKRRTTLVPGQPHAAASKTTLVPGETHVSASWQPPQIDQWQAPAGAQWQNVPAQLAPQLHVNDAPRGPAVHTPAAGASKSKTKGKKASASAVRPSLPKTKMPDEDETLPAGLQGAPDFDPRASRWMWVLFNPTWMLKIASPVLSPLRLLIFVLPLALLGALNLATRNLEAVQVDLQRLVENFDLVEHWIISLLTVNLAVTVTTAMLAFRYRATVSGFGIALIMRFYPRFSTRIGHLDQLSRVERMWLHGAPLLVRLFLFSAGIFVWFASRTAYESVPAVALAMSMTAGASFLFSANPLIKSNGYHLLSAFTNEPHLRGKAFKALLGKLRGGSFKEANELLLATYAVSMGAFMFVLVVGAASFIGFALHQLYLGGSAIIIASVIGIMLGRRVLRYFGRVEAAYDRSLQFDRWRKRTHGEDEEKDEEVAPSSGFASYIWKAALLTLFVVMFLPYSYDSGGPFEVHPKAQQVITTDVSGRIDEIFYQGGETVPKGTVVARLAMPEEEAQAKILEMQMAEQHAIIDHLESLPRPQQVKLARATLKVEETQIDFDKIQMKRIADLVQKDFAPSEELDNTRRQLDVDKAERNEKAAALEVAKMGPTKHEILAAQAKLASLEAEREAHLDRIRRAELVMPFDGRILTQYLQEKGNSFYKSGDVFAAVEAEGSMTAEVEIPESETEYLEIGSLVEFKPIAYSNEVFTGTVVYIDWDISERTFGNVINVIVSVDDDGGKLKNGMTGYAKVEGPTLPVWEAFSRQVLRFVQVQVWSWIP
jgi:putative peptide zinc metalloprotease protein